jgi:geranylgeranyl diphosphate synthase type II
MFLKELEVRRSYIEEHLKIQLETLEGNVPDALYRSMEYSLLAGGKRIRPILLMEVASLQSSESNAALPLALAMEMIHTYSLIHDDLPAMDNDALRRGRPTNHVVFGEQVAILAGDGLLNFAYETMLSSIPDHPEGPYLQAMQILAQAAGPLGMVGGQVDDIHNDGPIQEIHVLESINRRKTGALIRAAVLAGATMAGVNPHGLEQLAQYSEHLGLAFQIVDDILDVEGDVTLIGKQTGNDLGNHKITYPAYYGLDKAKEIVESLHRSSLDCLHEAGAATDFLIGLTGFVCHRQY